MNSSNTDKMIDCQDLVKIYKTSKVEVMALQGLNLCVEKGEMLAIIGRSGSGKSTLLNMLGGLDRPTTGSLLIGNVDMLNARKQEIVRYKRDVVGFVWQNTARNLVPYLSALQNVQIPMMFAGNTADKKRAEMLLDLVGLSSKLHKKPEELSGGEQQRVAIAIALANSPQLLLADEPTGSVDSRTAVQIIETFRKMNEELGITVVIVTHDTKVSKMVNRVVRISDGRISTEMIRKSNGDIDFDDMESNEETHDEYTVIDRTGRLQLSKEQIEAAGLKGVDRVKITVADRSIIITPPDFK